MLAARLDEVAPDGASTLVTYGLLNLTHRDGQEQAHPLGPGEWMRVSVVLNDIAEALSAGHRIRLALATSHWPIAWPSPGTAQVTVRTGKSRLTLPLRLPLPEDEALRPFDEPEAEPYHLRKLGDRNRTVTEDPSRGDVAVTVHRERSSYDPPAIGLSFEVQSVERYGLREGDPNSARAEAGAV